MKKLFLFLAVAAMATSCSSAKLISSATHSKAKAIQPIAALYADLKVSPTKITHFLIPSKTVIQGGYDNVINSAVREALMANGNADVLVALETQVKYTADGVIESVTVTGYPATYTNFRSPGDDVLKAMAQSGGPSSNNGGHAGGLKIGLK
jgi:hypothetical protein